jgi:hypothetical protein
MDPLTLNVDSSSSKLVIRTRAVGMLARLAHDLELTATNFHGHATRNAEGFSGELVITVAGLRVAGQLQGDRVNPAGISNSDRQEIEKKIRGEVFAGVKEILVLGMGTNWDRADITVETGHGKTTLSVSLRGIEENDRIRLTGRTELSLAKLGVREIKGPLGAFKVKDAVEVLFEIILRPAA